MKDACYTILILYYNWETKIRGTINEHLRSFENYSDHEVVYLNVALGIPFWVKYIQVDLVIYHYTIMGFKWVNPDKNLFSKKINRLKEIKGYKIVIPQDEYVYNDRVCRFLKEHHVQSIFTCFKPQDYAKAYPKHLTGIDHLITVYPGYVDEVSLQKWTSKVVPHSERKMDIGYRARKNPFWLGYIGVLKWKVTEVFQIKAKDLKVDLSNNEKDVFLGDNWYKFLLDCRCVLGVESGSTLLDFDGTIRDKVESFQKSYPNATFEDCEKVCFDGLDGNIDLTTVSPRHFEAAMTRTCQVLVEGDYAGVLEPDKHYIPVKKDFSNMDDILSKIKNIEYCESVAERAYQDIVLKGNFTYRDFVNKVLISLENRISQIELSNPKLLNVLRYREKNPYLFSPFTFFYTKMKGILKLFLRKHGLLQFFIGTK